MRPRDLPVEEPEGGPLALCDVGAQLPEGGGGHGQSAGGVPRELFDMMKGLIAQNQHMAAELKEMKEQINGGASYGSPGRVSQKGVVPAGGGHLESSGAAAGRGAGDERALQLRSGQGPAAMTTLGWGGMRPIAGAAGAGGLAAVGFSAGGDRGREGLPLFPDLADRGGPDARGVGWSDAASHHGGDLFDERQHLAAGDSGCGRNGAAGGSTRASCR